MHSNLLVFRDKQDIGFSRTVS